LLDMMQLQNLCVNSNLASIGNRANLIDRLLHSCGSRSKETVAAPTVELNNNMGAVGLVTGPGVASEFRSIGTQTRVRDIRDHITSPPQT